jgi:flavorubredoxin
MDVHPGCVVTELSAEHPPFNPLPREIAPGVFWLARCLCIPFMGKISHGYNSSFLVVGETGSAFIETGITIDCHEVIRQFEELRLTHDIPDPTHIFVTHSEMGHSGGLGLLLDRFPSAHAYGDVSDHHLVFPRVADRLHFADPGDRFDLGGREIVVVEGVFRDLVHTRWFFDVKQRVLFPGDGFAFSHYHDDGACGRLAEETPDLAVVENTARFADVAFHWTRFVDIDPYVDRLQTLIFDELDVAMIASTHGLPIGDPVATMPAVMAGLRAMRTYGDVGAD